MAGKMQKTNKELFTLKKQTYTMPKKVKYTYEVTKILDIHSDGYNTPLQNDLQGQETYQDWAEGTIIPEHLYSASIEVEIVREENRDLLSDILSRCASKDCAYFRFIN